MKYKLTILITLIICLFGQAKEFHFGNIVLAHCGFSYHKAMVVTVSKNQSNFKLVFEMENRNMICGGEMFTNTFFNKEVIPYEYTQNLTFDLIFTKSYSIGERVLAKCGDSFYDAEIVDLAKIGFAKVKYNHRKMEKFCGEDYNSIRDFIRKIENR